MRIRRHFTSLGERGIAFDRRRALRWLGLGAGAVLAGYLTAYLILFPAPILPGHQAVPRVLGLTVAEAQAEIQKSRLQVTDGGAEPHPTAAQGLVVWQDPPPGVIAPEGTKVTLVSSAGPPKIPVPDIAKLDVALAQSLVTAAGLVVSQVESVQAAAPTGLAMLTRPPAGTPLAPGASGKRAQRTLKSDRSRKAKTESRKNRIHTRSRFKCEVAVESWPDWQSDFDQR